jgi:hypothetical protein
VVTAGLLVVTPRLREFSSLLLAALTVAKPFRHIHRSETV